MSQVLTKTFHKAQGNVICFILVIGVILFPPVTLGRVICIYAADGEYICTSI